MISQDVELIQTRTCCVSCTTSMRFVMHCRKTRPDLAVALVGFEHDTRVN